MTRDEAVRILGGETKKDYRRAMKKAHPDMGGDGNLDRVKKAWKVVQRKSSWGMIWTKEVSKQK